MNSLGVASPLSVKSEYTEACLLSQTNFGSHQLPTIYHFCCSFMVVLSLETTVSAYAPAKTPFLNNKMGYGAPKSSTNSTIPMVRRLQSPVAMEAILLLFQFFLSQHTGILTHFDAGDTTTTQDNDRDTTQQQPYNHKTTSIYYSNY